MPLLSIARTSPQRTAEIAARRKPQGKFFTTNGSDACHIPALSLWNLEPFNSGSEVDTWVCAPMSAAESVVGFCSECFDRERIRVGIASKLRRIFYNTERRGNGFFEFSVVLLESSHYQPYWDAVSKAVLPVASNTIQFEPPFLDKCGVASCKYTIQHRGGCGPYLLPLEHFLNHGDQPPAGEGWPLAGGICRGELALGPVSPGEAAVVFRGISSFLEGKYTVTVSALGGGELAGSMRSFFKPPFINSIPRLEGTCPIYPPEFFLEQHVDDLCVPFACLNLKVSRNLMGIFAISKADGWDLYLYLDDLPNNVKRSRFPAIIEGVNEAIGMLGLFTSGQKLPNDGKSFFY